MLTISPSPYLQFLDDDGSPLAGGFVTTRYAGLSALQPTYTDAEGLIANDNPVQLDASGRCTMFLLTSTYDFDVRRSDNTLVRTAENIASTNLGQVDTLGDVFIFGGSRAFPITVTAYPVGTGISTIIPDTIPWTDVDSANLVGTYALQATIISDGSNNVTVALVNLSDGSPETPMVTCVSNSAAGATITSLPIVFPASGAEKNYAVKAKLASAGSGYVWGVRIVRVA